MDNGLMLCTASFLAEIFVRPRKWCSYVLCLDTRNQHKALSSKRCAN